MTYEVRNLTTATDPWCGTFSTKEAAQHARSVWAQAWPTNRYVVRRAER